MAFFDKPHHASIECPSCKSTDIENLDIHKSCCDWITDAANCNAIF